MNRNRGSQLQGQVRALNGLLITTGRLVGATFFAVAVFVLLAAVAGPLSVKLRADEVQGVGSRRDQGKHDQQVVAGFLKRYCFDCHAADTQEANIRLDTLDFSSEKPRGRDVLQTVLRLIRNQQMPPEGAEAPTAGERQLLSSALARLLTQWAEEARRSGSAGRERRLTVEQYNFTMQSLFGVDAQFADGIPPDAVSQEGFRNNREHLGISALHMECYLDSARRAVARYVGFPSSDPRPLRYHIELEDLYYTTADRYGTRKRAPQPVSEEVFQARRTANRTDRPRYIGPLSPIPPGVFPAEEAFRAAIPKLHQQFVALPKSTSIGEMMVRVRAAAIPDRNGRFPRMRVESGITLGDGDSMDTRMLGEVDVTARLDEPRVYEFRIRVEDVPVKSLLREEEAYDRLSVFDMIQVFISNVSRDDTAIYALGRGAYPQPDSAIEDVEEPLKKMAEAGVNFLYLDCIEIEMLPDRTRGGGYDWSVDLSRANQGEKEPRSVVSELLAPFMRRAYRRPVSAAEIAKKLELFESLRASGCTVEQSVRETLAAVLISQPFLFLECGPPPVENADAVGSNAHQRASRLSYFLWSAPPDEQLMKHADDGSLMHPDVWSSEAERLLQDPRSRRLSDSFCRQWLRLDKFSHIAVDPQLHPVYDQDLAAATVDETLQYFAEVFASDCSALDLIDSDYAILNNRLADHYGLAPVTAGELRKVPLPKDSVRGGLLTQASLLTMNSDGRDSHPIRRGVWLLDRLLNMPPPPPPPDVPDIDRQDPDFRGLTLKQRIELHRQPGSCQSCHKKIDPWGLALETFDATGRWREIARAGGQPEGQAEPGDSAVRLANGRRIDGIAELQRCLREEYREQFTGALVHYMLTYALGRSLDFADQPQFDAIHNRFAASDYRLKELALAIVDSEAFRQ